MRKACLLRSHATYSPKPVIGRKPLIMRVTPLPSPNRLTDRRQVSAAIWHSIITGRTMRKDPALPISHPVSVARLPQRGMPVKLAATESECEALAREHGLIEVKSFTADLMVAKWRRDGVKVTGTVTAEIVQACSITLEPLDVRVENQVEAVYVPEHSKLARVQADANGEIVLDPDGPDAPETFAGDHLDVGQVAEEFFGLGIDPYPRKPGAELPPVLDSDKEPAKVSAFAKLADFKQKQ
jgi:uncharacterized metal-binding protein YceD (DUF177 family)